MASVRIGMRQAARLSQMSFARRLDFIAAGLPIVLESARGFLNASRELGGERRREVDVLAGHAEEEAAKGLILLDVVRCPPKLVPSKLGTMAKYLYDHLARLIYAEACAWKPMDVAQLQQYVNRDRRMHYVDGDYGEYIMPNDQLFSRESRLYSDIAAYEDGKPFWNAPQGFPISFFKFEPPACQVIDALAALGAFSSEGLTIIADVWGQLDFRDTQNFDDSRRLTEEMLHRLIERNLALESATQDHVTTLYNTWQFPMYNIDLSPIAVSMEELEAERGALYPREY